MQHPLLCEYRPYISPSFTNHNSMLHYRYMHTCCGPGGGTRLSRAGSMHTSLGHSTHRPPVLHSTVVDADTTTTQAQATPPSAHPQPKPTESICFLLFQTYLNSCFARQKESLLHSGGPFRAPNKLQGSVERSEIPTQHPLGPHSSSVLCRGNCPSGPL